MAEVMSMIPDETPAGELNADEQESLQVGEQMEQEQEQRLAGKYKNAEELEAAYIELQKKLGESPNETSTEEQQEEEQPEEGSSILDRLWEEANNENVSEETLKELSSTDPSELAKMYLDYRSQSENQTKQVLSQEDVKQLKGFAGGEEKYTQMLRWASENLTEQEISMYDSIMDKGDPAAAFFAVQALSYRYQDANGVEGNLVQGKAPTSSSGSFRSQAELVQAMSDPRYDKDPAYRQDVIHKLERSNVSF
jgi:hypothetical protein